ncbi:hypothetical protein AN958_12658 [Leucoagaricus sp. SymC.cos]|nr:hypothetical protein AN958_12658 [Leucoagaricus sp. SymC.cos]
MSSPPSKQSELQKKTTWYIIQDDPLRLTRSQSPAAHDALLRLSDEEYALLERFRNKFPSLTLEDMGRPSNAFILFRSEFVAKIKKEEEQAMNAWSDEETIAKQKGTLKELTRKRAGQSPPVRSTQSDLSVRVGIEWKKVTPTRSEEFQSWAMRAKLLWTCMYLHGRPGSTSTKPSKKHRRTLSSNSSASICRPKFQPLPSPPVSDGADFEENESGDIDGCDGDDEYYPARKAACQSRACVCLPSRQKRRERELPTPASTPRELSPLEPSPVLSNPDKMGPPSSPEAFKDVSLAQLNYNDSSALVDIEIFDDFFETQDSSLEQVILGYSIEEHATNTVIDWDHIDLMSDLDPTGLYPIINASYSADFTMADLTDDLGFHLDHPTYSYPLIGDC